MPNDKEKMSFNATWSMAVGGMVGGGIFSVLGVIIHTAGQWAWLSFVIAGLIALVSAHSYSHLSTRYRESGGAYTFLNEINRRNLAAGLAWVLILGYILTISVYAFTFGHYVAHVFSLGNWFSRILAFAVIALLTLVNLKGVSESSTVEIITVWGKLFVLLGLALFGLVKWDPAQLVAGIETKPAYTAIMGAATIFMAYEGFQLLSYDYDEIRHPRKNLPRAIISSVIAVMFIYVLVSLGATMLVGARTLYEQKEVALSVAGQKALGTTGLILVTIAAAFSTGSAINATLFSTARLMAHVAEKKDLPSKLTRENRAHIPYYAILSIAALATLLSVLGSLSALVDAASLVFLITFGIVNLLAYRQRIKYHFLCLLGAIACAIAVVLTAYEQLEDRPVPLIVIGMIILFTLVFRPLYLQIKNPG